MTKKEYLKILLDKLSKDWDFARLLIILLKKDILTDKIIDLLFDFFSDKLKIINNENEKNKLGSINLFLEKIKKEEQKEIIDKNELNNLLNNI